MKTNQGFTLIELVVVLVVMGILLAVAVPKYVDLTTKAGKAADDSVTDSLRAATLMLMASNALAGSNVVHTAAVTNYWPRRVDIMASMQFPNNQTVYTNRYYTTYGRTNFYDFTNGVWRN